MSHRFSMGWVLLGLLAGCSQTPREINPVVWWHDLEGGAIADQRPPPPAADQPFPNLGSVPAKPTAPDVAMHRKIAESLTADRGAAQYAAARAPLPQPSGDRKTDSANLFGRAPQAPQPPPADAPSATLAAAAAPAAPARPAAAADTPATTPPLTTPLAAPPPALGAAAPAAAAPASSAAPPAYAVAPPPPPDLPGAPPSAAVAPAPPPRPPAKTAAAGPRHVVEALPIGFEPGSAVLTGSARDALNGLAGRRKGATVQVTGFGEAPSAAPAAQAHALGLALSRAQAMAATLAAAGVPAASVQVQAEAGGRGGVARLIQ